MTRTIQPWILLGVVLLVAAPVSALAQDGSEAKQPAPVPMAKNVASTETLSLPLAPASDDYRLGVNDVLDVHVWREPELSRVIPVRPDGKISLPLAGELKAEGRTALELREVISERLKAYVAEPEVTVIVQQINSPQYFIMGEIQKPGAYPLTIPTTVMQALAKAGGFREWADTNKITVLRRTEDEQTVRIQVSYKDWFKNKKQMEQLQLISGDVIVVP